MQTQESSSRARPAVLAVKILEDMRADDIGGIRPPKFARIVGVSDPCAYAWTASRNGKPPALKSYKLEGVRLIDIDDAIEFLRQRAKVVTP